MSTQPSTIPSLTPPSKDGGETEPNRLSDEPQSTIPKMPPHWQKAAKLSVGAHKTSALSHAQDLFPLIFTLAFGHHTPEELWDITFDKTEWRAYIDRLSNRLSSILIVVSSTDANSYLLGAPIISIGRSPSGKLCGSHNDRTTGQVRLKLYVCKLVLLYSCGPRIYIGWDHHWVGRGLRRAGRFSRILLSRRE